MKKLNSKGFDYINESFLFKVRKVLRYIKLYGVSRTIIKIKGQYHMKKTFDNLPSYDIPNYSKKNVAIVGCGNFAYSNIAFYLRKNFGNVIRVTMDQNINRAASLFNDFNADYYTDDFNKVINDNNVKLIYIVSNHASHADYAIKAIKKDKFVHIEKPHVVNENQLEELEKVLNEFNAFRINLGFNRPYSKLGKTILKELSTEKGTSMINWFIAGHAIDDNHWYYKDEEGGRILGNLCHWTDFTFQLVNENDRYPIKIIPTRFDLVDHDIVVNYVFGNGTIASISFSAKGHVFEGVVEKLEIQKENKLLSLSNFGTLKINNGHKVKKIQGFRSHGHEDNIIRSFNMINDAKLSQKKDYIIQTANLFLKTKLSLEENKQIIINS